MKTSTSFFLSEEVKELLAGLAEEFGISQAAVIEMLVREKTRERDRKQRPVRFEVNENGCHICTSHRVSSNGYIEIRRNGKKYWMHRWVFLQAHGYLPPVVRHKCDQPLCINIDHLEPGTHQDNMRDRNERGRTACGPMHGRVRLTEEQVRAILEDDRPHTVLARLYGCHPSTIYLIRKRKNWKRLKQPLTPAAQA